MLLAAITVNKITEQHLAICEEAMPLCAHLQICMHIAGEVSVAGCGIMHWQCSCNAALQSHHAHMRYATLHALHLRLMLRR